MKPSTVQCHIEWLTTTQLLSTQQPPLPQHLPLLLPLHFLSIPPSVGCASELPFTIPSLTHVFLLLLAVPLPS